MTFITKLRRQKHQSSCSKSLYSYQRRLRRKLVSWWSSRWWTISSYLFSRKNSLRRTLFRIRRFLKSTLSLKNKEKNWSKRCISKSKMILLRRKKRCSRRWKVYIKKLKTTLKWSSWISKTKNISNKFNNSLKCFAEIYKCIKISSKNTSTGCR